MTKLRYELIRSELINTEYVPQYYYTANHSDNNDVLQEYVLGQPRGTYVVYRDEDL